MDRHEQRVERALLEFKTASHCVARDKGLSADLYWQECARMALRDAVLMAEADGVRCE